MRRKKELCGALITMGLFLLFLPYASAQGNQPGLTLKGCLTTALAKNPTAVESGLAIKSADESIASARGRHWPHLSFDSAFTGR